MAISRLGMIGPLANNANTNPTKGIITQAYLQTPELGINSTKGIITQAYLTTPLVPTKGIITVASLTVPLAPAKGIITQAYLRTPSFGVVPSFTSALSGIYLLGEIEE